MPLMVVSKPPLMVSIEVGPPPGGVLPLMMMVEPGPLEGELVLKISWILRMAVLGTKPAMTMAVGQRRSSRASRSSRALLGLCGFCVRSFLDTNFEKLRMRRLSLAGRAHRPRAGDTPVTEKTTEYRVFRPRRALPSLLHLVCQRRFKTRLA